MYGKAHPLVISGHFLHVRLSHCVCVLSGRVTRRSLIVMNDWLPSYVPLFFVCVGKARLGRLEQSERPFWFSSLVANLQIDPSSRYRPMSCPKHPVQISALVYLPHLPSASTTSRIARTGPSRFTQPPADHWPRAPRPTDGAVPWSNLSTRH
jgi:hypothetical protein